MPPGFRRAARSLAVDTRSLRHSPAFRNIWLGQMVSMIGRLVTTVAVPFQVFALTHSALAVGLLGLAQAVPLVAVSLLGGSLADSRDRRRLLIATQCGLAACSTILLVGAIAGHPPLWIIYAAVFAASGIGALDSPARNAMIPNLVDREHLAGAVSLNFGLFQVALVAGPSIGGLVIGHFGLAAAYGIDVVSFLAALLAVWVLPPQPAASIERERSIAALKTGWQFLRSQPAILGGYAMDLSAMVFGMPRALFPLLAATTFHTGASGLGFMYAAPGLGGVLAVMCAGWAGRARRQGRIVVCSILVWGGAIALFGFTSSLGLGLLLLAIAGAADSFSAVCRNTMMQTITPNELRGRLSAVYGMVVSGGPNIGDVESGVVATAFHSAEFSVVSGGVLCIAGLLAASAAFPAVWRYRRR